MKFMQSLLQRMKRGSKSVSEEQVVPMAEIESAARAQGWSPDKGDKSAWQFLQDGKDYMDRARAQNADLRQDVAAMRQENAKMVSALANRFVEAEKREYEREKGDLATKLDEAIDTGDAETAKALSERLQGLKEPEPVPVIESQDPNQALVQDWISQNPWFNENSEMNGDALAFYQAEMTRQGTDDARAILPKVEERMRRAHPEFFNKGNPNEQRGAGVESDQGAGQNTQSTGDLKESDLTEDERLLWGQFKEDGLEESVLMEAIKQSRAQRGR